MPSRRTLLTALAAVSAGCTVGPGGTAESPTSSESPGSTVTEEDPLVTFDEVDVSDAPANEPILVASTEWRRWLRRAADGRTVRAAVNDPEFCGRAQLDDATAVALQDAGDLSGTYDLTLETGGHYRYPFDAEEAAPPADAPVYEFDGLSDAVASRIEPILVTGSGTIEPQMRAYEFVQSNTLDSDDYRYRLYVRRKETTYRLSARIPTYTPACGFYVVLGLSRSGTSDITQTLSLAGPDDLPGSERLGGESRHLSSFPERICPLLMEFEYLMTVTRCYRVDVYD